MGYVGIAYSVAVLAAPLLGGVVYSRAGYYAVYGMSFAVIGIDVLFRLVLIERKEAARWTQSSDVPLESVSPPDVVDEEGSGDTASIEPINTRQDGGRGFKLPPLFRLLKSRRMLVAWWCTFVSGILWSAFDTTLPLFCKRTFGWDSTGAGLVFLCISLPSFSGPMVGTSSTIASHAPREADLYRGLQ